ncbi:MAG: hypothetical protein KJO38_09440, partial [Gammaproteobacteria bacterium]|nr:hypothetical protein [Gammaproteobacteria bacterium]
GDGTLNIEAGGAVSSVTAYVGWGVASISEATVTGTDSQWTNSEDLSVGGSGGGALNVEASGEVLNRVGFVGFNPGSIGDVTVTGAGSTWTATDSIYLGGGASGAGGFGSLSVETGGTVDVTPTLNLWGGGTLTLDGGPGTLNFGNNLTVGGSLTLGGGTLAFTLIDGFMPELGDSFDVLDWSVLTGTFGTIDLSAAALPDGLAWNVDDLYADGSLSVELAPELVPVPLWSLLMLGGFLGAIGRFKRRR